MVDEARPKKRREPRVSASKALVTNAIREAMVAPALVMRETVEEAARHLGIAHRNLLERLWQEANSPLNTGAEKIAALRTLGEWIGTAKDAPQGETHNHLHAYLGSVPVERLTSRLAQLVSAASPDDSTNPDPGASP